MSAAPPVLILALLIQPPLKKYTLRFLSEYARRVTIIGFALPYSYS